MSYHTGTATDYVDLLTQLIAFVTGRGVATAVVNAAGTGYVVGDIVTVAGGTFTVAATVEVVTVGGGGAVTAVRVVKTGTYTVDPTTTGNAVTGGTGSALTLDLTMADVGWTQRRLSFYATSATIDDGGTGYQVGDILFAEGGTFVEEAAFTVTTIGGGGAVTGISLLQKGEYTVAPSNPVTTATDGAGTGAELNLTFGTDRNVILEGEGSGSDEIFVGVRTYEAGSAHNWELAGFTGYQAGNKFEGQPGISPGRFDSQEHGHYFPLNNATITFWLFATGRRIAMVAKMGSTYTNMYLGLLNPFATANEYPYPLLVAGCSSVYDRLFSSTSVSLSGLTDYVGHQSTVNAGPASIRDPGGAWRQVMNSRLSGGSRVTSDSLVAFPCGNPSQAGVGAPDLAAITRHVVTDFVPGDGLPGTPNYTIRQSPTSGDYFTPLWPVLLIEASPTRQILGELDGVYWVSADGEVTDLLTEDSIEVSSVFYHVFQNCNRTDKWAHLCVRRS